MFNKNRLGKIIGSFSKVQNELQAFIEDNKEKIIKSKLDLEIMENDQKTAISINKELNKLTGREDE